MLYRTDHLRPFRQFPFVTSSPLSLLPSPLQVQSEMEFVEAALKTSIRTEIAVKSSPQAFLEDLWAVNVQNGASCDDLFVDELLNFSNEEGFIEEEEEEEKRCTVSVSPKQESPRNEKNGDHSTNFSAKDEFVPVPASELDVPADDLASLEWLSNFVEDSNSEYSAPYPTGILLAKAKTEDNPEPAKLSTEPCFKTPVPVKARSKRARTGVIVWSSGSPSLTTESSSSSTTSSSSSCPSGPWLMCSNLGSGLEPSEPVCAEKPPAKKYKKPAFEGPTGGGGAQQQPRRCSHCGVQKTPQWRTGPLGAKTLCNACGVRYKSGRLLPEYRPACSPTFSSELHSNHHRKVLEMRKKKEIPGQVEPAFPAEILSGF